MLPQPSETRNREIRGAGRPGVALLREEECRFCRPWCEAETFVRIGSIVMSGRGSNADDDVVGMNLFDDALFAGSVDEDSVSGSQHRCPPTRSASPADIGVAGRFQV